LKEKNIIFPIDLLLCQLQSSSAKRIGKIVYYVKKKKLALSILWKVSTISSELKTPDAKCFCTVWKKLRLLLKKSDFFCVVVISACIKVWSAILSIKLGDPYRIFLGFG